MPEPVSASPGVTPSPAALTPEVRRLAADCLAFRKRHNISRRVVGVLVSTGQSNIKALELGYSGPSLALFNALRALILLDGEALERRMRRAKVKRREAAPKEPAAV